MKTFTDELIDLSQRSLRAAQDAERSFKVAVALKREGKCWGCRHLSHVAGECPERPTFRWDKDECECNVHEGQL